MNDNTPNDSPGGFTTGKFIALGAILTIGVIAGIKYMMSDSSGSAQPAASSQALFKPEQESPAPRDNPARRPESMSSGGALDMFQKANEGYSKEEGVVEESTETAAPEVKKATATATAAAKTGARAAAKKQTAGTVIPKMQPMQGFGAKSGAAGGRNAAPQGGAGMPDISGLMNTLQKNKPGQKSNTSN